MTVCNRCGKENQDHYKFCLGCGAELTAAKPGVGDMAMMKTMMQDPASGAMPGAPLRGTAGPMPGPMPGMRPNAMPGMPPAGPLGGPGMAPQMPAPMGPPPGVPGFSPGFAAPAQAVGMRRCPSCGSDVPPSSPRSAASRPSSSGKRAGGTGSSNNGHLLGDADRGSRRTPRMSAGTAVDHGSR